MKRKLKAVDLFCGAGGSSTGLVLACQELGIELDLVAINHWDIAIETHQANHPEVKHLCQSVDILDPRKVVPGGRLDLLVASPECTHHSNARGGKPRSDQSRASAWHVVRWLEALYVSNVLIENVREFRDWGPLDSRGRLIKRLKGQTYQAFLAAIRSLGYTVEERILNAADYGAATSRKRLFILARRGNRRIHWPEPTHSREGGSTLFGDVPKWRAAREIIDWDLKGESIFNRKRPLSDNTVRRIIKGLAKFGKPFLLPNLGYYPNNQPQDLDSPVPTITQRGAGALIDPCIIPLHHGDTKDAAHSVDEPMRTITATDGWALAVPVIVPCNHGEELRAHSIDQPMPTITQVDAWALTQGFVVQLEHSKDDIHEDRRTHSLDKPLPTVTAGAVMGLVETPFLAVYHGASYEGGDRVRSIDDPVPALGAANQLALVEPHLVAPAPYMVRFNGTGGPVSVDEPLPAVTGRDRFGLVIAGLEGYRVDIRFRMLQKHELARATGFPADYQFVGNRSECVKQIGNAVEVHQARALFLSMLGGGR